MDKNTVVCNFSPFYQLEGKIYYQIHVEDRTTPDVYSRFDIRIPSYEVLESKNISAEVQDELVAYLKENIDSLTPMVDRYQGQSWILEDMVLNGYKDFPQLTE